MEGMMAQEEGSTLVVTTGIMQLQAAVAQEVLEFRVMGTAQVVQELDMFQT